MNLLHFKPVDRVPAVHFGYWPELLTEWAEQGKIPAELAVGNYDGSPKDMELDKLIGWDFTFPYRFKHGTVLPITEEEHERIKTFDFDPD